MKVKPPKVARGRHYGADWVRMSAPLSPGGVPGPGVDGDKIGLLWLHKGSVWNEACRFPTFILKWPSADLPAFAHSLSCLTSGQ